MKVGVIQSSYIPWRGYFDFIDDVDLFVFHDDIQYTKSDWRNRNLIKTLRGLKYLTVPVKYNNVNQLICDTLIVYSSDWRRSHLNQFKENYFNAPFFNDANNILLEAFSFKFESISQLNIKLIKLICSYLNINTPFMNASDLFLNGKKTERLIDLLKKVKATSYLSGPSAKEYLEIRQFVENNIRLEYKTYDYEPYMQKFGAFIGNVTILDLIANMGKKSKNFIKSKSNNVEVI